MLDTKVGAGKKQPASDVAKSGYDAMMRGEGEVVTGWQNKLRAAMSRLMPGEKVAEMHRKLGEPGTATRS